MGSWSETCGLSHLPIDEGEDVVLVILRENTLASRMRDISDSFFPAAPVIYGTYNDYGSVNLDENYRNYHQHIYSQLMTDSDTTMTLEGFLEELSMSDIFHLDKKGYSQMIFKRTMWDKVVDYQGSKFFLAYKTDKSARNAYSECIRDIAERLNVNEDSSDKLSLVRAYMDTVNAYLNTRRTPISPSSDQLHLVINFCVKPLHHDSSAEGSLSSLIEESLVSVLLMDDALSELRLGWTINFGKGKQVDDMSLHEVLALATVEEIAAINKAFED